MAARKAPPSRSRNVIELRGIGKTYQMGSTDLVALADINLRPILADESCVTEQDVTRVAARFSGFNIKLVKCGGLTPALRMSRHGRGFGSRMMVGCMLESSALIAAGAVVAQQTQYADLDGAWLIGNDPFVGLPFRQGVMEPAGPGFGISPEPNLFGG